MAKGNVRVGSGVCVTAGWAGRGSQLQKQTGARAAPCVGQSGDAEDQKGDEGCWGRRRCFLGAGGVLRTTTSPRENDSGKLPHCCHLQRVWVGSQMNGANPH